MSVWFSQSDLMTLFGRVRPNVATGKERFYIHYFADAGLYTVETSFHSTVAFC